MKCPYKIIKTIIDNHDGNTTARESFDVCYGQNCPFYYEKYDNTQHCGKAESEMNK